MARSSSSTRSGASLLIALFASAALLAAAQATGVPRPPDVAGRGFQNGHGDGGHKTCIGATIDPYDGEVTPTTCGTHKDKCCEGWLCKTDKYLSVGYDEGKYKYSHITSIKQPSNTLLGDYKYKFAKNEPGDGTCCISGSLIYDITDLVCKDGYCDPNAPYGDPGFIKVKDLGFGKYSPELDVRNELSCLCCSGKTAILPVFKGRGGYGRADDVGDAAIWEKIQTEIDTTGSVSVDMLGDAMLDDDEAGAGRFRGGSWSNKKFKLFCHELPLTPDYPIFDKLKKILGACPANGY